MTPLQNQYLRLASLLCGSFAIALIAFSWYIGKAEAFLLLNANLGLLADGFFKLWSNLGEAYVWVTLFLYLVWKKRNFLALYFGSLIISTCFVQLTKHFILPNELRPTGFINNIAAIHTVAGVHVHKIGSFPSGHTSSAFTLYLLLVLIFPNTKVLITGFVSALLVGYARVYLAQHFPLDVAAGMLIAILSVFLSIFLQQQYNRIKSK